MTHYTVKPICWAVTYVAVVFSVRYICGSEPDWFFVIGSLIAGFVLFGVLRAIVENKRRQKQQRAGEFV